MDFKVLDASAFYAGTPFALEQNWYTTPEVLQEIQHIKKSQGILDTMLNMKRLHVLEPDTKCTEQAINCAKKTGDYTSLSKQDISILALGIQLEADILTDDYAISNVAKFLKLQVTPIMTKGITHTGHWIHYCPACRKNFKDKTKCSICGTPLRKKFLKA